MEVERSEGSEAGSSPEWLQHYKAASRRRRAAGHGRGRAEIRRRRIREKLILVASGLAVLGLTELFYLLLSR